jgi:fructose-1,6-bisphosphatase/sedoheptulose 1,7-bisphosphatase-like protein
LSRIGIGPKQTVEYLLKYADCYLEQLKTESSKRYNIVLDAFFRHNLDEIRDELDTEIYARRIVSDIAIQAYFEVAKYKRFEEKPVKS